MTAGTCHGEEPDTWLLVGPFLVRIPHEWVPIQKRIKEDSFLVRIGGGQEKIARMPSSFHSRRLLFFFCGPSRVVIILLLCNKQYKSARNNRKEDLVRREERRNEKLPRWGAKWSCAQDGHGEQTMEV